MLAILSVTRDVNTAQFLRPTCFNRSNAYFNNGFDEQLLDECNCNNHH